ncbi:SPOR domain-containing protein [Reichenbachiella ulvae]|uniref:SPOR domain-containing protein n=1 Tax=Reichenbachiella ulvae TaxID=2980104 RepID=A0ABT3CXH8_9BACT|nr:SPOR domain-containing protein [Reichenbachiella ulvae]MCV9387913.1 SPOR domain-containing protein [Reichenbachiella ulvae]
MKNYSFNPLTVFPIITVAALLQFCAPTASTSTSSSSYSEDLSVYRKSYDEEPEEESTEEESAVVVPKVDVEPTHDISAELDSVTNLLLESKKDVHYVDGFSIQIYSGNDRDKANDYKSKAYELLETQSPRVIYEQPNYKVRVGEYYTKLEANKDFNLLKNNFSRAVLIPSKIRISD